MADYQASPPAVKKQKFFFQPSVDWSDLYPELLEIVLRKLPLVDVYRSKAVCSSWHSSVKAYLESPSFNSHVDHTPWLVMPNAQDHEEDHDASYDCFYNLSEKKFYTINNLDDEIHGGWCIGSSLGWLVILDEKAKPYLTNPFSCSKTELPSLNSLYETMDHDEYYFLHFMRKTFFPKAILTTNPSRNKNFGVVLLYGGFHYSLAYYRNGDNEWTKLGESSHYIDIIYHKNLLFVLTSMALVEIWDIESVAPTQIAKIKPFIQVEEEVEKKFPRGRFMAQCYLVESEGDLLLVRRFLGTYVDPNGNVITEGELPWDEDSNPIICPYRTMGFLVYKLDFSQEQWVRVESIQDRILFLGGNQSVSKSIDEVPNCRKDSIYFTDDNWDQVDEDYMYGGHDMGFYSLKDGCINSLFPDQPSKICPPPFFVFPSSF